MLQVLFISNNKISDWKQIELLKQLPLLEHVVLTGNPIHEKHVESGGRLCRLTSSRSRRHGCCLDSRRPLTFFLSIL